MRINHKKLRDQFLGFPGEKLKDLVDAAVGGLQMVKKWGADRYVKLPTRAERFTDPRSGKLMDSSQAFFKMTNDYEKKKLAGEADIEEFSTTEGSYDPNFY